MISFKRKITGTTLVEVLTICILLGILAMMLLPNFRRAFEKTRLVDCMTNQKQFATILQTYYVEAKQFPVPDDPDLLPIARLGDYTKIEAKIRCPATDEFYIYDINEPYCDNFTIMCREPASGGSSHPKLGINILYPRYTFTAGLEEDGL